MARRGAVAAARAGDRAVPGRQRPARGERGAAGEDRYRVDFSLATGAHTRYGRLAAFDVRDYYTDWDGRDARMLCYTASRCRRITS